MKKFYCDRCDKELDLLNHRKGNIEIGGKEYDLCKSGPCMDAFEKFRMTMKKESSASLHDLKRRMLELEAEFLEGGGGGSETEAGTT